MDASLQAYLSATHARWLTTAPDRRRRSVEATLVFADVSGFTAMSEKLAKRGKIGAEETTEAVNRVFGGLLDATRACGGEILKFGGDAVLALFEGEAHQARGAAAALQMQASMKPLRRLKTAAGTVSLKLSAGVATGIADLFLAGSAPRELIVTGPLASEVVACESAAQAGQVVASPATLAGFPDRCRGEAIGPGFLLRAAPLVPMTDVPAHPEDFDPRPGLPPHLHDHEPGDGEHRFASVAFIQFKGTDALCAEEPDRLAQALDEIVGSVTEACLAYGVTFVSTDVDRDGGKVILAAGAPTASPDDEDRLTHALRSIVEREWPLPVRAGANRGRIFMVDIGPPERRVWSVMGDAVNLAARVMGRAEPGGLLATPAVLDRVRDDFERAPVEPFMVKGKSAPVRAEAVGPARGQRRAASPTAQTPLLGRENELALLDQALDGARAGDHRVIELVGEPGIGKSRLIEAAVGMARGLTVVGVAGGPYAVHSPYRALRAPLRELLGVRPDADERAVASRLRDVVSGLGGRRLEPWLPLIGIPFGLELPPTPETSDLSPEFARSRLHAATGRLVELLLGDRGVLLVVEDAHWLDQASSDLLGYLSDRRRPFGHLVLVSRRDVPEGMSLSRRPDTTVVRLEPLDSAAALALATGSADDSADPLPPGAVEQLVERAGGNPLLLGELLAAARSGEPLDALPASVEALVMARIDTLPAGDRQILRHAAVLGSRVPVPMLEDLLGVDAMRLAEALERLEDFLVDDGARTVRFRHALLRDAAYEALPYRRRRELHGRAGDLIEERSAGEAAMQAELLALHFHAAHRWEAAWRYAQIAGGQALMRAAPVEAAGFFGRAVEAGRALGAAAVPPAELADVAMRLGDAAKLAGRVEQAAQGYALARRLSASEPLSSARLCFKEGRLRDGSKHIAQALRWYSRGLKVLEAAEPGPEAAALRAQLVLAHGAARMRAGRLRESLPYLHRAVADAQACGARDALAHAYYCLDAVLTDLGAPEARHFRGLALPIYEELGDHAGQAKVLCNLGIDAYYEDRWDEAVTYYERSRRESDRIGDVVQIGMNQNNIGEIRADQGHLDEAEALFEGALSIFRSAGFEFGVASVWANLGYVATRRGDVDRAGDLLARARARFIETGSNSSVLDVDVREAERLLAAGRPDAALRLAGQVREAANALGASPKLLATLQRIAGAAELATGDAERARGRLRESVELARSVEAAYEEGLALELLGEAGGDDASEAAAAAIRIWDRLGVLAGAVGRAA